MSETPYSIITIVTVPRKQGVPLEPKLESTPRLRFTDENNEPYPKWEEKKLGEMAKIRIGFTPSTSNSSYWEGDNQWLAVSGINSRRTNKGTKTISNEATNGKQPFPPGTLLMSFKLSVGKLTITDIPIYTNEAICGFELSNDIQRDYLMYALEISDLTKGSERAVKGITLNKAKIVQIPLPLPSLPEQKKIGAFLSALDDEVEQAERLVSLLSDRKRAYAQSIFNRTLRFHDDNGNPYPEWEEKKLGDVAEWHNGYAFKPKDLNGINGTPVVKIKEMLNQNDIAVFSSIDDVPLVNRITKGDLLFSWSMTIKTRFWKNSDAYLNQHLYKVIPNIDKKYLAAFLDSEELNLSQLAHGGTAKHITRKELMKYSIPLPSLPEQEKIGSFLSALDDEIDEAKRELGLLKERKKAYAQRIFGV